VLQRRKFKLRVISDTRAAHRRQINAHQCAADQTKRRPLASLRLLPIA
jgi:hypothetical protein